MYSYSPDCLLFHNVSSTYQRMSVIFPVYTKGMFSIVLEPLYVFVGFVTEVPLSQVLIPGIFSPFVNYLSLCAGENIVLRIFCDFYSINYLCR